MTHKPIRFDYVEDLLFSKNWNNKLYNQYFTTIRLLNKKFTLGSDFSIVINTDKYKKFYGIARIESIKKVRLIDLTTSEILLDAALSKEDFQAKMQSIYGTMKINTNTEFQLILLHYQTKHHDQNR